MIRTTKGFDRMQSIWGKGAMGVLKAMTTVAGVAAPQHDELARTGSRVTFRSPIVARAFVAIVRPGRGLDRIMTPALEAALGAWIALPIFQATKDSLNIDVGQTNLRAYYSAILGAVEVERLIDIGVAAAESVRAAVPDAA